MPTLQITPKPDNGLHQLEISAAYPVTRVQRTDRNGTRDIRTLAGQLPATANLGEVKRNHSTNGWPTTSTGWLTSSGYVKTYEATSRYGRTKSMCFTKSAAGGIYITYGRRAGLANTGTNSTSPTVPSDVVAVVPGEAVTVKMDLATDTTNAQGKVTIRFFDAAWASVATFVSPLADLVVGEWQSFTASAVTPAGATSYWLEWSVELKGGATCLGGEKSWASRVLLGPDGDYFDGGSTDSVDLTYAYDPVTAESVATGALGPLVLDDYEAAQGTSTYTVTTTGGEVTGTAFMDLGLPWLGVPVTPQFSARVKSITGYGASLEARSTVLEPDGSPFPIVIGRGSSSRRGTLEIWAGAYDAAWDILRLVGRGQIMFLRQAEHEGMDMFFSPRGADIRTLSVEGAGTVFGVSVDYVEVSRPGAPLSGALGWDWAELKNTYATWGDVLNAYATWGDVRTNTP